jgi:hypothetical protein
MRLNRFAPAAFILIVSRPVLAQDWIEYTSHTDFFSVNFPSEPKVQETTYRSQYGYDLPARVYSAEGGQSRYSATVVDYSVVEKLATEKSKTCPQENVENCIGGAIAGLGYWKMDVRGALVDASWRFFQRDAKVTSYLWEFVDLVEGHQLQLTNADQSRTHVGIYMHQNRLYILEATVPKGYPPPAQFQQSLGFNDKEGAHEHVRYQDFYSNAYPPPPRVVQPSPAPQGR